MALKLKQKLLDENGLTQLLDKMAHTVSEEPLNFSQLAFIGILKNGAPLARYLAKKISEIKGVDIPVACVDISLYRDDHIDTHFEPFERQTEIPFPVTNREIVLVDDVLFTGRTVRAALRSILELGRPKLIRLAVVVDRGHREMPIRSDYTGLTCETSRNEGIRVRINTPGQKNGVYLYENYFETSEE